ncbi:MAG: putative AlkP superfamily pyrophosphatase or phosphodiesterase [Planctomycetota bacterium]|jgi:predicted AlkP superfamily pyrophosphatase or phosphodiesterase
MLRRQSVYALVLSIAVSQALGQTLSTPNGGSDGEEAPRLVLQITVDQLRGDLIRRYANHWGEGGFKRLLEEGAVFANAHHAHANTETIVGHVTLATGAYPSTHGMVGNLWYDRNAGVVQYNVEDAEYPVLSSKPLVDQETEIDPTQRAARSDGRSPRAILSSTFSDELMISSGARAKVFGVSVKDRGAISLAGHTGTAYWFSKGTGEFVTSSYYRDDYPEWVTEWNAKKKPEYYASHPWTLSLTQDSYLFGDRDDRPFETELADFGRVFPHSYGDAGGKYYTTLLTISPAGDELTLDFAKSLFAAEDLGADDVTDYLSVSFSSTDYVGHLFGPSSLESEDNLVRLDRSLADLLDFVDEHVGLERTLVVLSADHGGVEAPEYLRSMGMNADYITNAEEMSSQLEEALGKRFGLGDSLVQEFVHPYVFLNHDEIEKRGLNREEVTEVVASNLQAQKGIAYAFTSEAMRDGNFPDTRIANAVAHNFHPNRSGDVYLVTEPYYFVNDFDGLTVATTHVSPWRYDTHVPVIFMGAGIQSQTIQREIFTIDVAASLAAFLGTNLPSGCDGEPLVELFR